MTRTFTLRQLAYLVGGRVEGDPDTLIQGLNGIDYAQPGEITFVLETKQLPLPAACQATACIAPMDAGPQALPLILAEQPSVAAARIHAYLLAQPFQAQGIHPSAVVGKDCVIPQEVTIGPLVCLGDRVVVGQRVAV